MATWRTIATSEKVVGASITTQLVDALDQNLHAALEAASGAPNVRMPDVLRTPAAGDVVVLEMVGSNPLTMPNSVTAYETNEDSRAGTLGTVGCTVIVAGVIRVTLSHAKQGASGSSDAKVMKNGVSQGSWSTSSTSYSSRSVDVTVAKDDIITIMHRNTNGSGSTNLKAVRIKADANDLVVV